MTVLCWNTTWISVHSSDYKSLIFAPPSGIFYPRVNKLIIIINVSSLHAILNCYDFHVLNVNRLISHNAHTNTT